MGKDGELTILQEQAEHIYSHSAVSHTIPSADYPLVAQLAVTRASRRRSTNSDGTFFDSGADGDVEKTHTISHWRPHCKIKRKKLANQISTHYTSSISHAQSNSRKRSPDNLDFLTTYDDMQPTALDRQSSKPANPSSAKKRRNITDPTYRASFSSSSEEDEAGATKEEQVLEQPAHKTPAKKRKRIADPTYRAYFSSSSEEETLSLPRAGSLKRKVLGEQDPARRAATKKRKRMAASMYRAYFSSERGEEVLEPARKRHRKRVGIVCGEGPGLSVADVEDAQNAEEEDMRRDYDDEEFVWERDWCRVM